MRHPNSASRPCSVCHKHTAVACRLMRSGQKVFVYLCAGCLAVSYALPTNVWLVKRTDAR